MEMDSRLWQLLGKLTSGEANKQEQEELDELLKGKGSSIQYMMSVLDHYWGSVGKAPEALNSATGYIQKFEGSRIRKLRKKYLLPAVVRRHTRRRREFWFAALILVLLGGWLSWHTFISPDNEMNIVSTRNGSKTKVALPDGTQVWLNSDSKLTYPNDFQHINNREVTLSGEAFFKVQHDADRPFIIHTRYLDIKDIGTSFNVKAYPEDEESEATLVSGIIEVTLHNDQSKSYVLKPKEKVVYHAYGNDFSFKANSKKELAHAEPISKALIKPNVEISRIKSVLAPSGDSIVAETAWMNNQLVFDAEKFSSLAKIMGRWYNVDFEIKDKNIADYSFTGVFEGETLEQALDELQMIRPFQYRISKDHVIINN